MIRRRPMDMVLDLRHRLPNLLAAMTVLAALAPAVGVPGSTSTDAQVAAAGLFTGEERWQLDEHGRTSTARHAPRGPRRVRGEVTRPQLSNSWSDQCWALWTRTPVAVPGGSA